MNKRQLGRSGSQSHSKVAKKSPAASTILGAAMRSFERGELAVAEALCRQAPRDAASLHLLGMILYRSQRLAEASVSMEAAVRLAGSLAAYRSNYALVLHALGRLDEAVLQYGAALRLDPKNAEAHNNLGMVLQQQQEMAVAEEHYREALRLRPRYVECRANLGALCKATGRLDEAIALYRSVVEQESNFATAHYNLANALSMKGEADEALTEYIQTLSLDPKHVKAHTNIGDELKRKGLYKEALAFFQRAVVLQPATALTHYNLGCTQAAVGEYDEAIASYRRAMYLDPSDPRFQNGIANAYFNQGDLHAAWPYYEHRHELLPQAAPKHYEKPRWGGPLADPLRGRRILLQAEQGLGDTLQCMRYVPLVVAAGGRVLLQVQPCLRRLAQHVTAREGGIDVITTEEAEPEFDVHCLMMSLPFAFQTTLATIPACLPCDPAGLEEMAAMQRYPWPATGLRVGLVWAGNPDHPNDRNRSLALRLLDPILRLPAIHFFPLQVGPARSQLDEAQTRGYEIADLNPDVNQMSHAAACITQLDLVITVDTAVAHLAGTLGKPTWVLLPREADWRWIPGRTESPWYPSMSLFRQTHPGDWTPAIEAIADRLANWA